LDEYADEDDKEVGQALLKRDANKLRSDFKNEQQQFINSIQAQQPQAPQFSEEEIAKQKAESLKMIQSGVKSVVNGNLLRIESNGEGINYQVSDVNKVIEYAAEPDKFLSSFAKDGGVDWKTWTMLVALKDNPEQFVGELIKHGKSLGRKAMEAELKNAAPITNTREVADVESLVEKPSDNPTEFLKGMKVLRR
jgi:predicted ribosome quality control (RQC) complex YloA/Tae2 family protein